MCVWVCECVCVGVGVWVCVCGCECAHVIVLIYTPINLPGDRDDIEFCSGDIKKSMCIYIYFFIYIYIYYIFVCTAYTSWERDLNPSLPKR